MPAAARRVRAGAPRKESGAARPWPAVMSAAYSMGCSVAAGPLRFASRRARKYSTPIREGTTTDRMAVRPARSEDNIKSALSIMTRLARRAHYGHNGARPRARPAIDLHRRLLQAEARLRVTASYGGARIWTELLACDRLVWSPDVAPLRGSITEEEATETPHPSRSITCSCVHSGRLNPALQVDLSSPWPRVSS
jgi:hypothetical protein